MLKHLILKTLLNKKKKEILKNNIIKKLSLNLSTSNYTRQQKQKF